MEIPKYARRVISIKNIVLMGRPVPSHAHIHIGETFGAVEAQRTSTHAVRIVTLGEIHNEKQL